jgi:hypothetical protein
MTPFSTSEIVLSFKVFTKKGLRAMNDVSPTVMSRLASLNRLKKAVWT